MEHAISKKMAGEVLIKLNNIIKCQDGQDYHLLYFNQNMIVIFESLSLLSEDDEAIIAISYAGSRFHKYNNNIIDCQIEHIKLECEEGFTLYYSYDKLKDSLNKNKHLLDFNDIEHIYYSNLKQTLFEWMDIFNMRGGQAAITGNVDISYVEKFCKEMNCTFELYSIED